MCFWILTKNFDMNNLSSIVENAIRNDDSHGFYCIDCKELEFSMDFTNKYQVNLLKHTTHTIAHHSRITSAGDTCEMNAQPLQSNKGVLLHNGTCSLPKVEETIKEVKLTFRQDISDSVAMNLILANTKDDDILEQLEEFNAHDWIGNLMYIRDDTIYLSCYRADISKLDEGVLTTAGSYEVYGTFDIPTKEFDVDTKKAQITTWWNSSTYLACGKSVQSNDCLENITACKLHGCTTTICNCNKQAETTCMNYVSFNNRCDRWTSCVDHDCDSYNCHCPSKEEDRIAIINEDDFWIAD